MSVASELQAAAADYARHHSPETQTAWREQQAGALNHGNEAGGAWSGGSPQSSGQPVGQPT
ncbi:hypothetical protein [Kitasatospora sp. HPMI-4]|uniref:hypothetical protein n=1 Tax=Kitasatospora sp. HPMI-4 TaxID=3448443 RepID=UPI003F1AC6D2